MEEAGRRRSSRISSSGQKRKRNTTEQDQTSKAKMSKPSNPDNAPPPTTVNFTFDQMKQFMHGEFRTAIIQDIEKSNKMLSDRID